MNTRFTLATLRDRDNWPSDNVFQILEAIFIPLLWMTFGVLFAIDRHYLIHLMDRRPLAFVLILLGGIHAATKLGNARDAYRESVGDLWRMQSFVAALCQIIATIVYWTVLGTTVRFFWPELWHLLIYQPLALASGIFVGFTIWVKFCNMRRVTSGVEVPNFSAKLFAFTLVMAGMLYVAWFLPHFFNAAGKWVLDLMSGGQYSKWLDD